MISIITKPLKYLLTLISKTIFPHCSAWELAQLGELYWQKKDKWRHSVNFENDTKILFNNFGFNELDFVGGIIIDLGAGSKLRTKYFKNAKIVAIEPLANKYLSAISWCDLSDAWKLFSRPAEEYIEELRNTADLIISINVLDHCLYFDKIIRNIFSYLKSGAFAFLSFDSHKKSDFMHPLKLSQDICDKKIKEIGFKIEKYSTGIGPNRHSYGHGHTLNYWLRKEIQ